MATKTSRQEAAQTAEEIRSEALEQLAVVGGKLTTDDDVTFHGTKFVIPAHLSLAEGAKFLDSRVNDEENDVSFSKTFPYRPHDGARATALAIKEFAGFTLGKTLYSFFGRELPQLIEIKVGPRDSDVEQVPWGAMSVPGLRGLTIHLGATKHKELGLVFVVTAEGPRKYRFHVNGLFDLIAKHLRENSIYKGKAIDGGENFIDVSVVNPLDVVFSESVQRRLEGDVWCFIRHSELLDKLGQNGKFAVLFEGTFGVGKSLAAVLTAQVAQAHGWTFLMCRPGQDDLITTLEMARMYQPAVVFAEDVDTTAGPQARSTIERHLDVIDGIKAKGLKLLTVFTTNHAEEIHKGMLRPGRIGAVIRFGAMDRPGVEILARRVIGHGLDDDTDFDEVFKRTAGYMPAFVREVFDRSVRYAITLNDGELGMIGTEAICMAADGLRDQYELMEGAKEERASNDLASAFGNAMAKVIKGTEVIDYNDEVQFTLAPSNGG